MRRPVLNGADRRHALALLMLACALPGASAATDAVTLAVVAHRDLPTADLRGRKLADVFLRRVVVDVTGKRLVPVNLPGDSELRRRFSLAVLGMPPEQLEAYWNERYFHGTSPPHVVASVEAMMRFVSSTPGAIGYVPSCAVDERVQIVDSRIAVVGSTEDCPTEATQGGR